MCSNGQVFTCASDALPSDQGSLFCLLCSLPPLSFPPSFTPSFLPCFHLFLHTVAFSPCSMKLLNSIHFFLFFIFSIPHSPLLTVIKFPCFILCYFEEVCTSHVSLPKFSFTSLTHTATFSHHQISKLTNDILCCQGAWVFSLFLFIFLGIWHISLYLNVLFSCLGVHSSGCSFFHLFWIFFFLIHKHHIFPRTFFLGSLLFSLCVILGWVCPCPWLQVPLIYSYSQPMPARFQTQISVSYLLDVSTSGCPKLNPFSFLPKLLLGLSS